MSFDVRNLPAYFSSNADFQAWVTGIHAQLAACGLIQTADTGQINPATVTTPVASNTVAGYEIWRFNDTAVTNGQSTNPCFIKIEYGTSGATNRNSFWFTTGSGSNGTGTITGVQFARAQINPNPSTGLSGVTLYPSYCAGDGGWIGLLTNMDTAQGGNPYWFIIDRIRDATGTPTGEGFVYIYNSSSFNVSNPVVQAFVNGALGVSIAGNNVNAVGFFSGPTVVQGGAGGLGGGVRVAGSNVSVLPMFVVTGLLRYLKCGIIYSTADLGSALGTQLTANNFGANHTYQVCQAKFGWAWGPTSNDHMAMLWE